MPYVQSEKRSSRKTRRVVNIHQNKFPKAYISTIDNSRRPIDSLSDMTNMELVQDNIIRPRPPLIRYGTQTESTICGRGSYRWDGQRVELFMLDISGTGKLYKRTDGGAFNLIGGTYDETVWTMFTQAAGKVYIYNGVDNLSYLDLDSETITTYTTLDTPTISSVVKTGLVGTTYTQYYRVSANNAVGESIASAVGSVTIGKIRDAWILNTDYIDVTWGAVAGATSYTVYTGDTATTTNDLITVTGVTYRDDGSLAVNPFKIAPEGNSTDGPILRWMYTDTRNSQLFGIDNNNKLYYSAPGTGDFSPYNGGGYVTIDENGDTELNYVDGFRTGKGDPVISIFSRGAAGKGKLSHVTFDTLTVGDQAIVFPTVLEANGQSGTYAPRGVVKARDSLYYFTGDSVKSTGTSQNIVNILTTNTVSQVIEPDIETISLSALDKSVGVEYQDKIYWALPIGSETNNEIWYLDLSRKNAWILRWPINADDLWLYEDNSGVTHLCALVDNVILEFTRAGGVTHQDDDVAWRSRVAFSSLVWDEDGITLGSIRNQYFKFLQPKGVITVNATGLTRKGVSQTVGSDTFEVTTTPTGYDADTWLYDVYMYDEDPGTIDTFGKSVSVLRIKPRGLLAELSWEVIADTSGTDYLLSSVNTKGFSLDDLILKA